MLNDLKNTEKLCPNRSLDLDIAYIVADLGLYGCVLVPKTLESAKLIGRWRVLAQWGLSERLNASMLFSMKRYEPKELYNLNKTH